MKPGSGSLVPVLFALCLPVLAQDTKVSSPSAAQPASVAATSVNTVGLNDIRIVRLSQVRGQVNIDRHIGRGYEEAFVNIPITGGTRIHTDLGLAEVEFEDNSTVRLTPDSEVEFTMLKRTSTGSTISAMSVLHGMVYATVAGTKGNTFTVAAGKASLQMNPNSHVRLTMDGLNSNLTVLDGSVQFTDPFAYTSTIKHKESLDFDAAGGKQPEFAKLKDTAFDDWDRNGNDYQKLYASQRLSGGAGLYGSSDLNYYGSFVNMPGCGSMWRPYFASAAWSPYDNGMWAYYPSVGYSWVSPYPWGWLPFHSGNWMSCGAAGWGWSPGASFTGLQNVAAMGSGVVGAGGNRSLVAAPPPPRAGAPAMVPVNNRPLAVSSISSPGNFTFRKDSAGLGVPRDAFGDLKSISSDVAHHGMVNTEVERSSIGPSPAFANRNANGNGANSRATAGRENAPGSRSVATFSRPEMRANSMDEMNGISRTNNGMENGVSNRANQGSSMSAATPNHSWQRAEPSTTPGGNLSRGAGAPSSSTAPSAGGGSSSSSTPAAHK
jgi:FecR protein